MDYNNEIINELKKGKGKNIKVRSKYISNLFTRTLIAVIIVLLTAIYINIKDNNLKTYKKYLFEKSLSFNKISSTYNKLFGKTLPLDLDKGTAKTVFNDGISYNNIEKYNNGFKLTLTNNVVQSLYDGIVVFIGEKENYGKTIIIQGTDGVDIWYGNVLNVNVTLYDYINKDTLIGETIDENLYLVFNKENEYLSYEEYLK